MDPNEMPFSDDDILLKVLIPRDVGLVFEHAAITYLDSNLFDKDITFLMRGVQSKRLKFFLFPYGGGVASATSSVRGEYTSAFGMWKLERSVQLYGRDYDYAWMGSRRLIHFRCATTNDVYEGVDFWSLAGLERYHFAILLRDGKAASLIPRLLQAGNQAVNAPMLRIEVTKKFMEMLKLGFEVISMGGTMTAAAIEFFRRSSSPQQMSVDEVNEMYAAFFEVLAAERLVPKDAVSRAAILGDVEEQMEQDGT